MVELDQESVDKFKKIYEKEYGKKISDKEAREMGTNLVNFVKLLIDMAQEEEWRKERLKKEPKGFYLDDTYNCCICHNQITGKETWYDKYGIKCLNCQRALDKKIIPKKACKNRDNWYASWELKSKFNIPHQSVRRLIREGKLKPRTILDDRENIHFQMFMKKENDKYLSSS